MSSNEFNPESIQTENLSDVVYNETPNPWQPAFEQCKNYRKYLKSLDIGPDKKINSYLLTREAFERLLSQEKELNAVRIYIGHEVINNHLAVRLFAVACKENKQTGRYEDWEIPKKSDKDFSTMLGEVRPCPNECSTENDLNTDS